MTRIDANVASLTTTAASGNGGDTARPSWVNDDTLFHVVVNETLRENEHRFCFWGDLDSDAQQSLRDGGGTFLRCDPADINRSYRVTPVEAPDWRARPAVCQHMTVWHRSTGPACEQAHGEAHADADTWGFDLEPHDHDTYPTVPAGYTAVAVTGDWEIPSAFVVSSDNPSVNSVPSPFVLVANRDVPRIVALAGSSAVGRTFHVMALR